MGDEHERICNLPYAAEYAKRGSEFCRKCNQNINNESVMLALRDLCQITGRMIELWHHVDCFFTSLKKGGVNEQSIRGMNWLKWEDQERIRENIKEYNEQGTPQKGRDSGCSHFCTIKAEHAKSARGKCASCSNKFDLFEVKYCYKSAWNHLKCLMDKKIQFIGSYKSIGGFNDLATVEKDKLEKRFGDGVKEEEGVEDDKNGILRVKTDPDKDVEPTTATEASHSSDDVVNGMQSFVVADDDDEIECLSVIPSTVITLSLEGEEQSMITVEEPKMMTTPRMKLPPLPVFAQPEPKKAKVEMTEDEILKQNLKRQAELQWDLRQQFKQMRQKDIIELLSTNDMHVPTGEDALLDRAVDAALFGVPSACTKCPSGHMVFSTSHQTYVCLGHLSEWTKCTNTNKNPTRTPLGMNRALVTRCPVLQEMEMNALLERFYPKEDNGELRKAVPELKVSAEVAEGGQKKSVFNGIAAVGGVMNPATAPSQGKLIIKKGTAVDGEFAQAAYYHVYRDAGGDVWSTALGHADMATNRNSYLKMQLLQHDVNENDYTVFQSSGRVGTDVGNVSTRSFHSLSLAQHEFKRVFLEKTGNQWADRKYFRKKAGKMCMVDIDHSELENEEGEVEPGSKTKLEKPVQSLIMKIFDKELLKMALKSFDLDMEQMPLGKLSKKQLTMAYAVLNELQAMMDMGDANKERILDASNRFYTLVPHNFGMRPPELLNSNEIIQNKSKLLDDLMDIAVAVNLMNDKDKTKTRMGILDDPIDINYVKLQSDIEVLPKNSSDFVLIEKYLRNTHGSTHQIKINIVDPREKTFRRIDAKARAVGEEVFKVARNGERDRFHADLGNRMLLWHGSGIANFVGIISQGLRIAPPEAPHAGYMFGKGIYFADMVSKSANYCRVERNGGDAFLLLCDVALGIIQEEQQATNQKPLRGGANSVKGIGMQYPDPEDVHIHEDGYIIPFGKTLVGQRYQLEYNEFIVYDVRQVNIRYLVRTTIDYYRQK